jgi:RNA polymerase sigma-70 factor (ECF subfamily)
MVAGSPAEDAVPAEVIRRAREGDSEAFGELYRRFSRRVLGLCLHLLGKREDAEDATSEVFMKLRAALGRYDDSLPFRPWLTGVAAKHCLDRLRRRRRELRLFETEREEPPPNGRSTPGGKPALIAEPGCSPLASLLAEEGRVALGAAIAALPSHQRVPLVLRYHGEMSYDEIAERLDWTRQRVAVSLFRAKQSLRRALRAGRTEP